MTPTSPSTPKSRGAGQRRRIIATSALPYANGSIHIGHLVEYLQTDMWSRFQKMRGHECIYVCADDTHGTPIMVKARELGITPETLVGNQHKEHARDFSDFGVGFDIYSSTNSNENKTVAEEFYTAMRDAGHTVVREIQQLYCNHDKMFLPDRFVKGICPVCSTPDQYGDSCDKCGATYSPSELKSPRCSICATTPVERSSSHVFFKLNDFRDFLKEWMPAHTQKEVAAKLMEWFEADLRDWDISRDAPYFGFEIPGYPGKYFYVWIDAPIGYISSTWQWCQKNGQDLATWWKNPDTEIYHFIGKDITYFHLLFWPAMLKSTSYRLPTSVFVHGHLTVNGEKMSKSKGTSISARTYLNHLDPMYLRYYYACKLTSRVDDLDLNITDFVNRVNSDLIGKITNLGSRGAQMLKKRIDGKLGKMSAEGTALVKTASARSEEIAQLFEEREFAKAINAIREIADSANQYFDEKAPWNLIKEDVEATREVLTATLNIFRLLSIYLAPVLPDYSNKVAALLNEKPYLWADSQRVVENCVINEYEHLATRVETAKFEQIIQDSMPAGTTIEAKQAAVDASSAKKSPDKIADKKTEKGNQVTTPANATAKPAAAVKTPAGDTPPGEIEIDDFTKIDLRIAKIIEAEAVPEADKLLRLKVSLGEMGERQIFAGIKAAYRAEDLVGRLTIVVANLKPRKMKFGMSEGMVLAAGLGGSDLFILSPDDGAKPGQRVK
jgi:methionyl-tRNA synthetase